MRFAMPAGIAAAVLIGVMVLLGLPGRQTASAAEMLKAAAASSRDFSGWIHAKLDFIPDTFNREGGTVKAASLHLHLTRKIRVKDTSFEGIRTVEWVDMAANIEKTYDSTSNSITIADLPQDQRSDSSLTEDALKMLRTEKKATAWQIGQTLFGMPSLDGVTELVDNGWCGVAAARDGENDRYTLMFNKDRLEDPAEATKASLVVVVDHKAGQMRQWVGTFPSGKMSLTFTYNEPAFNDITDVDIPADVRIHQYQAGGDKTPDSAAALLDRLDKLAGSDEQLGTYTAVMTEAFDYGGKRPAERCLRIYGRQGKAQFYGFYRNTRQAPFLKHLPGWPLPEAATTVAAAGDTLPDVVLACDGSAAWRGWVERDSQASWQPVKVEDVSTGEDLNFTLTGTIWSGRHDIDFKHGSRIKIDIQALAAADRPGEVGVQVDESGPVILTMQNSRIQMAWWVDPARNDVPTAKISRWYDLEGNLSYEDVTTYSEYAQFPSGVWYPTAWHTQSKRYEHGQAKVACTCEHRLQFVAGMALEPVWFSKPQEHFRAASGE